jgi:hypothetical protein
LRRLGLNKIAQLIVLQALISDEAEYELSAATLPKIASRAFQG